MATRMRPQPDSASHGSRTMTITADEAQPNASNSDEAGPSNPILRLRGGPSRTGPRVQWDEEVIDNEGMGKKKSKICCIYHKPRAFDESSSSGSSSDSSEAEEDTPNDEATGKDGQEQACGHKHHKRRTKKKAKGSSTLVLQKDPGANAYEQQPKPPGKGKETQ